MPTAVNDDASRALPEELMRNLGPVPKGLLIDRGRPAAVLVGLIEREQRWHVVMTKRAAHLTHHAGQISFPGGKVDPGDISLNATALREAHEEIALQPAAVNVIGALDTVASPVGFVVQPVVGIIRGQTRFVAAPDEVESVLVLPLADVLDPVRHRRESYLRDGQKRDIWVIDHDHHHLWGLSASIIVDLSSRMKLAC